MAIIKREINGIEFYSEASTGESGMSESGLARLCDVARQTLSELLQELAAGKARSKCLKPFAGKDLWLQARGPKGAKVVRDEVCAVIIEHYAFEARTTTNGAVSNYRKFAKKGVRVWIQEITGWGRRAMELQIRKEHRNTYSQRKQILKEHGVHPLSQGHITRQDYKILLQKDTKEIREEYKIPKEALIVDYLKSSDQATLSFAHMMQIERLENRDIHGYYPAKSECADVMKQIADFRNSLRSESNNQLSKSKQGDTQFSLPESPQE